MRGFDSLQMRERLDDWAAWAGSEADQHHQWLDEACDEIDRLNALVATLEQRIGTVVSESADLKQSVLIMRELTQTMEWHLLKPKQETKAEDK